MFCSCIAVHSLAFTAATSRLGTLTSKARDRCELCLSFSARQVIAYSTHEHSLLFTGIMQMPLGRTRANCPTSSMTWSAFVCLTAVLPCCVFGARLWCEFWGVVCCACTCACGVVVHVEECVCRARARSYTMRACVSASCICMRGNLVVSEHMHACMRTCDVCGLCMSVYDTGWVCSCVNVEVRTVTSIMLHVSTRIVCMFVRILYTCVYVCMLLCVQTRCPRNTPTSQSTKKRMVLTYCTQTFLNEPMLMPSINNSDSK